MVSIKDKIINLDSLTKIRKIYQTQNKKVVFTNGCFDILHSGHVLYLEEAKNCGDILILALNSDESVKRLKGPTRPINSQQDRAIVLAGLSSIDHIVVFDEDTPYNVIKSIIPDILVKGGDWTIDQIIGSDIVKENGGEVISLSFQEGKSTTGIIRKVVTINESL